MGFEGPAVAAVVSRLPNPTVNLAAWGGVVFPLALMVEAPIIMMLAASTALCRDWASYMKMRRFMNRLGAGLTALHILIVATPLYYVIAETCIGAPEAVLGACPDRSVHHDPLDVVHRLPALPPGQYSSASVTLSRSASGHGRALLGRRHDARDRLLWRTAGDRRGRLRHDRRRAHRGLYVHLGGASDTARSS